MLLECLWGENSACTPEVSYPTSRLWLRKLYRCMPIKGPSSNLGRRQSDGFDTHVAGSPLFAVAESCRRPTLAGATTTTTALQRSSSLLLALFNLKMNRFLGCTT